MEEAAEGAAAEGAAAVGAPALRVMRSRDVMGVLARAVAGTLGGKGLWLLMRLCRTSRAALSAMGDDVWIVALRCDWMTGLETPEQVALWLGRQEGNTAQRKWQLLHHKGFFMDETAVPSFARLVPSNTQDVSCTRFVFASPLHTVEAVWRALKRTGEFPSTTVKQLDKERVNANTLWELLAWLPFYHPAYGGPQGDDTALPEVCDALDYMHPQTLMWASRDADTVNEVFCTTFQYAVDWMACAFIVVPGSRPREVIFLQAQGTD